MGGSLTADAQN